MLILLISILLLYYFRNKNIIKTSTQANLAAIICSVFACGNCAVIQFKNHWFFFSNLFQKLVYSHPNGKTPMFFQCLKRLRLIHWKTIAQFHYFFEFFIKNRWFLLLVISYSQNVQIFWCLSSRGSYVSGYLKSIWQSLAPGFHLQIKTKLLSRFISKMNKNSSEGKMSFV